MYIRRAMKIDLGAPVNLFPPYLENDLALPLDLHYMRVSPWLQFSSLCGVADSMQGE